MDAWLHGCTSIVPSCKPAISPLPHFFNPNIPFTELSSLYRNFHFAPCWCSLFTVVGFPGARCIISNLKGSAYAPSPVTNDNQHQRFVQHRGSPRRRVLINFKIIANPGESTIQLNKEYSSTGIGGAGGKGDGLFDETFGICKLYGL